MIDFTTTECLFPEIFAKPAVLQFDQQHGSSDGGVILLKAAERRYGLIGGLAGVNLSFPHHKQQHSTPPA